MFVHTYICMSGNISVEEDTLSNIINSDQIIQ